MDAAHSDVDKALPFMGYHRVYSNSNGFLHFLLISSGHPASVKIGLLDSEPSESNRLNLQDNTPVKKDAGYYILDSGFLAHRE
jgi:hypothetical protein